MTKAKRRPRKHVPQRTCVGCRKVQAKQTLTRIVRTPDGVVVDPQGKRNGRGAYLHNNRSCWQKGLDGRLANALKTSISPENAAELIRYSQQLPEAESLAL